MTESSQAETWQSTAENNPDSPKPNRFVAILGYLIFAFCIAGLSFDLFEMGRFFWGVSIVWLLIVRLIFVIKRPDLLLRPSNQLEPSASADL